jgi:DNA-binding GntR family transcriptional regulator
MPNESAYSLIRETIVRGRIGAGAKLVEGDLAKSLNLSRTPIREALQRLKHERLVVSVGGGAGIRDRLAVTKLAATQARQLYGIAGIVEGLAAREIANRSPYDRNNLARELTDIARAFQPRAEGHPDNEQMYLSHRTFHGRIMESAANAEAAAQVKAVEPHLDRYGWWLAQHSRRIGDFQMDMTAITQAIRSGDPEEIERAIRSHWEALAEQVADLLDRSNTKGQFGSLGD